MNVRANALEKSLDGFVARMRIQLLVQLPGLRDQLAECGKIASRHRVGQGGRDAVQVAEGRHGHAVAVEVVPHDLLKDVLGQAGDAGVVEECDAVIGLGVQDVGRDVVDTCVGHEARFGGDDLDAADAAADLVLPAAARGQGLLDAEDVLEEPAGAERRAYHALDHREHDGSHDAAGAEAAALGDGGKGGQLDAAAQERKHVAECGAGGP